MAALAAQPGPRLSRREEGGAIVAVMVITAVLAALSPGDPTGLAVWDSVLKAVVGAATVLAASKSPRWAVLVMATISAAAAFYHPWALAAWAGLALAIGSALLNRRSRLIGAVAAGLVVQTTLRLPSVGFFGLQSVIAVACVAPVLISGYRYGTRRARKFSRRGLAAVAVATVASLVLGGVAVLDARSDVERGISAARLGLQAARSGDTQAIVDELGRAEAALDAGQDRLSGISARLLRLVPVAAQNQRAIESATVEGALLAREASATLRGADISEISLQAGSVDLGLLQAMAPQLRSTSDLLGNALTQLDRDDSPWLLPAVSRRIDDLAGEIESFVPEISLGAVAADVVPEMLGANGRKTYFVFFGTPAESREFGGFVGSWAVITFDQGRLRLGESGRIQELYRFTREAEIDPGTVSDWFLEMARPTQFPQNLTSSPDFTQVAAISRQVLEPAIGQDLDGFLYLDAHAIADLLVLTGPVEHPLDSNDQLTADNADAFFFDQQYRTGQGRDEVFDSLDAVARTVLARLGQQSLPGPERLGQVLGPAARGGHLQAVTFDDAQNDFLRSVHLLRDFGRDGTTDFVGLVQTNGLSNKLDLYLHRSLVYEASIDDGVIQATATALLRSDIPADAPEATLGAGDTVGVNRVLLSLYSPHSLRAVTVDGAPVEVRAAVEFDLGRYLVEVDVPPTGENVAVEFMLSGQAEPNTPYSLAVWHQPLVQADSLAISVSGPFAELSWAGQLVENVVFSATS